MSDSVRDILTVSSVSVQFGGLRALNDVSFTVGRGEVLGVIGPNGAGKTTLLNVVSSFLRPTSGTVLFEGQDVSRLTPHKTARCGLVRSFQDSQTFPTLTVYETVLAASMHSASMRHGRATADRVMEKVGLGRIAGVRQDQLSLPDRKLLEISKCMAMQPRVMLLDEVMAGLTTAEVETPIALIEELKSEGVTFVLIEHVMPVVTRLADRIVVLDFGSVIAEGVPSAVMRDERVQASYLGGATHAAG